MAHTLREVRESKGITQVFIAKKLGYIDSAQYNRIEKDKDYVPRLDMAYKLSQLLDTPIDQLFPGITIKN